MQHSLQYSIYTMYIMHIMQYLLCKLCIVGYCSNLAYLRATKIRSYPPKGGVSARCWLWSHRLRYPEISSAPKQTSPLRL